MSLHFAAHHVAKENFAGQKICREARQSQAVQRQKDRRQAAMSKRRGILLEEAEQIVEKENQGEPPAGLTKLDRRQQLEQWKKKRERLLQMQKIHEKKPFKAGSVSVNICREQGAAKCSKTAPLVPANAASWNDTIASSNEAAARPTRATKSRPPPSTRTLRSANKPKPQPEQAVKETARVTRSSAVAAKKATTANKETRGRSGARRKVTTAPAPTVETAKEDSAPIVKSEDL